MEIKTYKSSYECVHDLINQNCINLGCLNDGKISFTKDANFILVFSNEKGEFIYLDPIRQEFYSVDSGD